MLIFALDVVTKRLAEAHLPASAMRPGVAFLQWRLVHNTGAAFGLFGHENNALLATLAALAVALVVAYQVFGNQRRTAMAIGLGMLLGGTLGNLTDRLQQGTVTDFMVVPFWPAIFNLADVGIRLGIVLAVVALLRPGWRRAQVT